MMEMRVPREGVDGRGTVEFQVEVGDRRKTHSLHNRKNKCRYTVVLVSTGYAQLGHAAQHKGYANR
jgi:hypothetical protein